MKDKYVIVVPCYNEGSIISKFLDEVELKLKVTNLHFDIIIVDDASIDSTSEILKEYKFQSKEFELKVIRLRYNMGHQLAIKQGLIYVHSLNSQNLKGIVVMDSDGEDDPEAILQMITLNEADIIFVERGKRKEKFTFKLGYFIYTILFRIIVGKRITYGNYSLISNKVLDAIVNQSFIHYAGFLSKQKFTIKKIKYDRQRRIDGHSKMSLKNLIFHGLYSFIEFAEEVLFTLMKLFFFILVIITILGIYVLYSKFISHKAIVGWASSISFSLAISGLIIISTIIIGLLLLSIKHTLNQKDGQFNEVR